jgi:hypothetical protein
MQILGGVGGFTACWMFLNWYRVAKDRTLAIKLADEAKWKSFRIELDCQFCYQPNRIRWTGNKNHFICQHCRKKNGIVTFFEATVPPDFEEGDTLEEITRRKMLEVAMEMNKGGVE